MIISQTRLTPVNKGAGPSAVVLYKNDNLPAILLWFTIVDESVAKIFWLVDDDGYFFADKHSWIFVEDICCYVSFLRYFIVIYSQIIKLHSSINI